VEVVDADGMPTPPGEQGSIVVTSLICFSQPFIRYRIGDVAVHGTAPMGGDRGCACGSPFATIGRVLGREVDYLTMPSGARVHAYSLSIPVRQAAPFILQYQLVQESVGRIGVRAVCKYPPGRDELRGVQQALLELLEPGVVLEFELVDDLPRQANGKFRAVVSSIGAS
jgi:phenylacetate-CoA ligase